MGKQGPCYHCGVTSTPLWRNGPPDKPVLCNACGSRWRTKGTLANYTPLHVRVEPDELEDYRVSKVKSSSIRIKEAKLQKRKQIHDNIVVQGYNPEYDINFEKVSEDDSSHRSSSGSTISHTEGCAQYGGIDARDFAGSAQSVLWDTIVPSRKRTCVSNPRPSPIEKLTKDLHCILHEQRSSYLSGSSEEDLLFESETPWMDSVEMGHGSVLIRHPNSGVQEEESEASSFSMDNKRHLVNKIHLGSAAIASNTDDRDVSFPSLSLDKLKKPTEPGTQHELMESLESMFDNPQFEESLSSFHELLAEGIFDPSFLEANVEDYKTLKRIALTNLTESKWIEHYNLLKDVKHEKATEGKAAGGPNVLTSSNKVPIKKPFDGHSQNFSEPLALVKSP